MTITSGAPLGIGDRVGPYRIAGELGGGGMGLVYLAVHAHLDRPAAIKVLHPELGEQASLAERFLTEARATTAIKHPGIVEVYDYGHLESGRAFIVMELLEGGTLASRLDRGSLPVDEAMTIARRIAAPLAAAHDHGVVHRDLKPENIFLVRQPPDAVKLLDFGIAKLESPTRSHHTAVGMVLGTLGYMSPEQCVGLECDARTDLYALGCVMFEMLAGRRPYHDVPNSALVAAHLCMPVPDVRSQADVPPAIAGLVKRLLAKSPDDRPRSAEHVVAEIDAWFAAKAKPRKRSVRNAVTVAIAIALAFTGIGAGYRTARATGTFEKTPMVERVVRVAPNAAAPNVAALNAAAPNAATPNAVTPTAAPNAAAPNVAALNVAAPNAAAPNAGPNATVAANVAPASNAAPPSNAALVPITAAFAPIIAALLPITTPTAGLATRAAPIAAANLAPNAAAPIASAANVAPNAAPIAAAANVAPNAAASNAAAPIAAAPNAARVPTSAPGPRATKARVDASTVVAPVEDVDLRALDNAPYVDVNTTVADPL